MPEDELQASRTWWTVSTALQSKGTMSLVPLKAIEERPAQWVLLGAVTGAS